MLQTILVLITFCFATGFILKKFIWNPIFENKNNPTKSLDGEGIKCGKKDCGCH
jgi:hypothetical protein